MHFYIRFSVRFRLLGSTLSVVIDSDFIAVAQRIKSNGMECDEGKGG